MFQTSTPVVGEGFHDREAELEGLIRAIQRLTGGEPQCIAILGPRKIGKTSLVLEAARRAHSDSLRVVTLDLQEQGPGSVEIFRRLALRVADAAIGSDLGELGVQVKRSGLPLRFKRIEWSRMVAEGHRFHWLWVIAAVAPGGAIKILDPAKARLNREALLRENAEIPNLLRWLDARSSAGVKTPKARSRAKH